MKDIVSVSSDYVYRNVKYIDNYDGDTIKFSVEQYFDFGFNITVGAEYLITVRLYGIDTPEMRDKNNKEKAKDAKNFVACSLIVAERITIRTLKDKKGKYGRYLAIVYYNIGDKEYCLNKELVKQGLAVEKEY